MLRAVLVALALGAVQASTAFGQDERAPAPYTEAADEAATSAMGDAYHALLFDTGLFDAVAELKHPEFRQSVMRSPFYQAASAENRAALDRVIESLPELMRQEVSAEIPIMADLAAARVADELRPEEITAFAAYLRSSEAQPLLRILISRFLADERGKTKPEPSADEEALLAAVEHSPMARALVHGGDTLSEAMLAEFGSATPRIIERVLIHLYSGICAVLGTECPGNMRRAVRDATL